MAPEVISRQDAKAKGLSRYYTGQPCKHGHVAMRQTTNGICVECSLLINKRWAEKYPERQREKWRRQSARHRVENPERINRNREKWELANPENLKERQRRYSTSEKGRASDKRWRENHRDKHLAKIKRWHEANRHTEEYKETNRARVKQWNEDFPEKKAELSRVIQRRRRIRKLKAGGSHTREQIAELLEKQNWQCVACKISLRQKRHLDHIQPLARGGTDDISNLQWLCPDCNKAKRDKDPIEWAQERGLLI